MKINTIHNIFFYMAAALAIVNGLTACSDKDESFLAGTGSVLRSADEINLTSGGVAKVFTVCGSTSARHRARETAITVSRFWSRPITIFPHRVWTALF